MGKAVEPKPRLLAVVSDLPDVDGLLDVFPGGDVFLDSDNCFKRAMGGGTIRKAGLSIFLPGSAFWKGSKRASKKYPSIMTEYGSSDGLNLGGVVVVGKSRPPELLLVHLEEIGVVAEDEAVSRAISQARRWAVANS